MEKIINRIYLSGAISNDKNYLDKFKEHEKALIEKYTDFEVFNPAEYGMYCLDLGLIETEKGEKRMWSDFMLQDLFKMSECTHIYFIPENVESSGREIERLYAERLQLEIINL